MITQQQAYRNIREIYKQSTAQNVKHGKTWYQQAHVFCQGLAIKHDYPVHDIVAALAVLSPNCSWETNKKCLEVMLETGKTFGNVYPDNVKKAKAILAKELTIEAVLFSKKRYGNKARAFFDNINAPDTSDKVTVDTHAIRGAFNTTSVTEKQLRWVFETLTGYTCMNARIPC